jgi:hypothetical protein
MIEIISLTLRPEFVLLVRSFFHLICLSGLIVNTCWSNPEPYSYLYV